MTFRLSGSVTGTIEARAEADLSFRIPGKLIERNVDVGDHVQAGEILARLDDQDQRNALRTAEADLAVAKAGQIQANNEEARKRELLENGNTTQVLYDTALLSKRTADAKVVAAQAARQASRDRVGYTELPADRDGVVTAVGPDPGQVVEAGELSRGSPSRRSGRPCSMSPRPGPGRPEGPGDRDHPGRRAGHHCHWPCPRSLAPGRSRHPDPYGPDRAGQPARSDTPRRHRDRAPEAAAGAGGGTAGHGVARHGGTEFRLGRRSEGPDGQAPFGHNPARAHRWAGRRHRRPCARETLS